jgi:hypothetical protein
VIALILYLKVSNSAIVRSSGILSSDMLVRSFDELFVLKYETVEIVSNDKINTKDKAINLFFTDIISPFKIKLKIIAKLR